MRLMTVLTLLLCSACSRPLMVDDPSPTAATVEFQNLSAGTLQQFTFQDPVTCDGGTSIDYFLEPHDKTTHKFPSDRLVTIWTSGFNLPAKPGEVAWCRPTAFTTRLEPGQRYLVTFVADTEKDFCGTLLTSAAGDKVVRVMRTISGPEIGGGGLMAGPMSCNASDDLSSLTRR